MIFKSKSRQHGMVAFQIPLPAPGGFFPKEGFFHD